MSWKGIWRVTGRPIFTYAYALSGELWLCATLSDDGDPIDACVLTPMPIVHGCIIAARPIGVLMMEDESGVEKAVMCAGR